MHASPVRQYFLIRMAGKSRQIRRMFQRGRRKCVKRRSSAADWGYDGLRWSEASTTAAYARRNVQENSDMCRNSQLVLITKSSRQFVYEVGVWLLWIANRKL